MSTTIMKTETSYISQQEKPSFPKENSIGENKYYYLMWHKFGQAIIKENIFKY